MKRSLSERRKTPEETGEPRRHRSVKWDEANLEENHKIKAELNPAKINEPKTPYHGPMDSDEEHSLGEADMAPLTLEDDAAIQQLAMERNGNSNPVSIPGSVREDDKPCSVHGWSDSERGEQSSGAFSNSHSSNGHSHGEECESDPAAASKHKEKRRRFEARRRQHYNMRDALKRNDGQPGGKELLSHEVNGPEGSQQRQMNGRPHGNGLANGYRQGKAENDL